MCLTHFPLLEKQTFSDTPGQTYLGLIDETGLHGHSSMQGKWACKDFVFQPLLSETVREHLGMAFG